MRELSVPVDIDYKMLAMIQNMSYSVLSNHLQEYNYQSLVQSHRLSRGHVCDIKTHFRDAAVQVEAEDQAEKCMKAMRSLGLDNESESYYSHDNSDSDWDDYFE